MGVKLTKQQLLEKLRKLALDYDAEEAHPKADKALLDFINDPEISEAYNAVEKWYA